MTDCTDHETRPIVWKVARCGLFQTAWSTFAQAFVVVPVIDGKPVFASAEHLQFDMAKP